uniref:Dihydroneopterin aldolase/epimerase domain-containing protein n=1 Tax=Aegilops tauschii subsp. strangulata TaxID=200361 RepID=A0A452XPY7_AEGTS
ELAHNGSIPALEGSSHGGGRRRGAAGDGRRQADPAGPAVPRVPRREAGGEEAGPEVRGRRGRLDGPRRRRGLGRHRPHRQLHRHLQVICTTPHLGQKYSFSFRFLTPESVMSLCRIAKGVVEGPSRNLLESVAQSIAGSTLLEFPQISAVRVKVGKPHVAVQGIVDYLGVEILRRRGA